MGSAGVSTEPWAAAGQADPLGTTGKWENSGHPVLLLSQAAQGNIRGALLESLNVTGFPHLLPPFLQQDLAGGEMSS